MRRRVVFSAAAGVRAAERRVPRPRGAPAEGGQSTAPRQGDGGGRGGAGRVDPGPAPANSELKLGLELLGAGSREQGQAPANSAS